MERRDIDKPTIGRCPRDVVDSNQEVAAWDGLDQALVEHPAAGLCAAIQLNLLVNVVEAVDRLRPIFRPVDGEPQRFAGDPIAKLSDELAEGLWGATHDLVYVPLGPPPATVRQEHARAPGHTDLQGLRAGVADCQLEPVLGFRQILVGSLPVNFHHVRPSAPSTDAEAAGRGVVVGLIRAHCTPLSGTLRCVGTTDVD